MLAVVLAACMLVLGGCADGYKEEYLEDIYYSDYIHTSCFSNGGHVYNVDHYGCLNVTLPDGTTRDILFDYLSVEDELLETYIAMYDKIRFDDYKYLAVRDGETWYYIDLKGSVVSGPYTGATAFNDEGYAMVMDENRNAYVINDAFEIVADLSYVVDIGNNGEMFLVDCQFENGEKANGLYGYYYGVKYE